MTLSIVARDPVAGLLGCAVTSCQLAAGKRVLHLRAGVGASVAQASSELVMGERLLDLVDEGTSAAAAVLEVGQPDTQLAVITAAGVVAVHTGEKCHDFLGFAGHALGDEVSAQVNCASLEDAPSRMLGAFGSTRGPLAERLVAALAASGGDVRGQQGAAVMVTTTVRGDELAAQWYEPHVDLRVDDHRDPVTELARLLSLHRAHNVMVGGFDRPAAEQLPLLEAALVDHPHDPHLRARIASARAALGDRGPDGLPSAVT